MRNLGRGAYGSVDLFTNGTDHVAVKKLICDSIKDVMAEINAFERLKGHENVLEYIHHKQVREDKMLIYMEVCDYDLAKFVKEKGKFQIHETLDAILQISKGLDHVHSNGIIHRDLKPQNILVKKSGSVVTYKITDFGVSRVKEANEETGQMYLTARGTSIFMAPEVLETHFGRKKMSKGYPYEVDIFSLGLVFYWLVSGKFLQDDIQNIMDKSFDATNIIVKNVSEVDLHHLIRLTLRRQPEKRPDIKYVVKHVEQLLNLL